MSITTILQAAIGTAQTHNLINQLFSTGGSVFSGLGARVAGRCFHNSFPVWTEGLV